MDKQKRPLRPLQEGYERGESKQPTSAPKPPPPPPPKPKEPEKK